MINAKTVEVWKEQKHIAIAKKRQELDEVSRLSGAEPDNKALQNKEKSLKKQIEKLADDLAK